jgi:hypothetical protein
MRRELTHGNYELMSLYWILMPSLACAGEGFFLNKKVLAEGKIKIYLTNIKLGLM